MSNTDPLTGPFVTSAQLTDYHDTPGYPITLPPASGGDCSVRALTRLGYTEERKAAA